ncbi:hypothetical protein [Terriglobus saanensis]|uniref:Uncharacterized protein n=1 Tax=Terriglobus saanensis (strain ATCC BAA-1853 / DSM 23119 / SP1PR4) TaxID=401053 RepID=E8UXT7_TERSS|nr:hypothetical protein [Terriglobus saanensis]ADV83103.1 hypothetical protein AciPR4_2309 [Terriglobus saanensis SP1PR4]
MARKISPVSGYMRPVDVRDLMPQPASPVALLIPSGYLREEVAA